MRTSTMNRQTKETNIELKLDLDGSGKSEISSGNGFFDHMLTLFAHHGNFDLELVCKGDVDVDFHHSCEDIGIVMGRAFAEALGDRAGICRYGYIILPMDEALLLASVDISGRGLLCFEPKIPTTRVGDFDIELLKEFWMAFAREMGLTLHIKELAGENSHHIIEGVFKAVARALGAAVAVDENMVGRIPSTKGTLL